MKARWMMWTAAAAMVLAAGVFQIMPVAAQQEEGEQQQEEQPPQVQQQQITTELTEEQVQQLLGTLNNVAAAQAPPPGKPDGKVGAMGEIAISEPFKHENLTLFMIYGKDQIQADDFLTLQEALEKKVVTIFETGNVGSLSIQNTGDKPVYIQSGEIVKGGKQDRTLQYDLIVPAKSDKMPLHSFCVEQGRWSGRGNENVANFSSSYSMLNSSRLKLAARTKGDQGEVWKEVANVQGKLSNNVGENVMDAQSATSLQLTLENKQVNQAVDEYVAKLAKSVEGNKNALGFAFAINGKVNSIDVYASGVLFKKLWPKLLRASAAEAVAELQKDKAFPAVTAKDVRAVIADMEKQKAVARELSKRTRMRSSEAAAASYHETQDQSNDGKPIHRSYLIKN